jgi:hypothetical protein
MMAAHRTIRTNDDEELRFALGHLADLRRAGADFAFVPTAEVAASLDHFTCLRQVTPPLAAQVMPSKAGLFYGRMTVFAKNLTKLY